MLNIAILGSTNGTSSQLLIDNIISGKVSGVSIQFILSNRKTSGILERARNNNIKDIYLPTKDTDNQVINRVDYDILIDNLLIEHKVELVLLIGYMKFMSSWFVNKWSGKVVNIHPSLLPAFAGDMNLNVHKAVLNRGCKVSGATLMFIDEGPDTGPIISQKVIYIDDNETPNTLKAKVQNIEKKMIVDFVKSYNKV